MPDLLTHVLLAYALATAATWAVPRFEQRFVPVAMIGAALPDIAKLYLLVDSSTVEAALGLPFDWVALHTLGPTVALAGMGALCFHSEDLRLAFACLAGGAGLHLLMDLAVIRVAGVAPPYLFPLTWWEPPSANLLLSSDPWPWMVATLLAVGVWVLDRRRTGVRSEQ